MLVLALLSLVVSVGLAAGCAWIDHRLGGYSVWDTGVKAFVIAAAGSLAYTLYLFGVPILIVLGLLGLAGFLSAAGTLISWKVWGEQ